MTLKEKFKQWFINDEEDEHYEGMVKLVSIEHEQIADKFAIEFAEWLSYKGFRSYSNGWANFETKALTEKELLDKYKKEVGL